MLAYGAEVPPLLTASEISQIGRLDRTDAMGLNRGMTNIYSRPFAKTCADCGTKLTRRDKEQMRWTDHRDCCILCFEYAGWENTHSDFGHAQGHEVDENCWVCHPELLEALRSGKAPEVASKDSTPHSWSSHKGHDHPATQAARKACRAARSQ